MERKGRGSALGVGDRHPRAHRGGRRRLDRPSDEEAAEGQRAGPRRRPPGGRRATGCGRSRRRSGASCPSPSSARRRPGDLVLAEKVGRPPRLTARVDPILGDPFAPRSFSLIAIHKHGIPHEFPDARARGGGAGGEAAISASARTSPTSRSSRSTRPMRATMTTRSGRRRTTIRPMKAAGRRSSPSPTSASTSAPARRSTRRRGSAATASISPTGWCRCCPRR